MSLVRERSSPGVQLVLDLVIADIERKSGVSLQ